MLFISFENLKKNHRWLVTLLEFCPKNLSLYFFYFLHLKTFPKWYHTCILVIWIKSYIKKKSWSIVDTKHVFFKNRYYDKKFFWWNELTCGFRNTIYIFLSKIWNPNFFLSSIYIKKTSMFVCLFVCLFVCPLCVHKLLIRL
jgi:hypothetical protein